MRNLSLLNASKANPYTPYLSRACLSIIASHLLVYKEEEQPYIAIFSTSKYYSALIINALMAYLLITIICKITRGLDHNYPWYKSFNNRAPKQIFWGIIAPILPAILMCTLYFAYYGINSIQTVYFTRYLQQIILLLIILNFYMFYQVQKQQRSKSTPRSKLEKPKVEMLPETYSNIAYIFIAQKNYFAYTFLNEKLIWPDTLTKSISYLPSDQFYLISRSFIVNKAAIAAVKVITAKKTKIKLLAALNVEFNISQRENTAFKKWFSNLN